LVKICQEKEEKINDLITQKQKIKKRGGNESCKRQQQQQFNSIQLTKRLQQQLYQININI